MSGTVLIENSTFYPQVVGGAEMSSWLLAQELSRRGWKVHALASTGRLDEGPTEALDSRKLEGISGEILEAAPAGSMHLLPRDGDPAAGIVKRGIHHFQQVHDRRWRSLAGKALDRTRPDLVHTNTIVGLTTAVWEAARERGIPVVHTLRDFHLLCPRTTLQRSDGSYCKGGPAPCQLLRGLKRRHLAGVSVVTAPSRFNLQTHVEYGFFRDIPREVVPNACEGALPEHPAPGRGDGMVQGLFLGQIAPQKGVAELLTAIESLLETDAADRMFFAFAGQGEMRAEVEDFCARHPRHTKYHGMLTGEAKTALLRASDYMLIPSTWNDNFPRTMLDAFMHGLPVIGARRGGIPEAVEDGVTGRIIEPVPAEIERAILDYTEDAELRKRHGGAAFARAVDYTLDRQLDRFLAIYRKALGARILPT